MRVLVDMDDVLWDLAGTWTSFLNGVYNLNVKPEDIQEWSMAKAYPTLTEEQIYAPLRCEAMWASVKPMMGVDFYLEKLLQRNYDIVYITAAYYDTVNLKIRNALFRCFPFISYDNVIIATRKQLIRGDVMIDDLPRNLIGGEYKGVLFDAPHNQSFDAEKYGLRRAKHWGDVYDAILDIEKELEKGE